MDHKTDTTTPEPDQRGSRSTDDISQLRCEDLHPREEKANLSAQAARERRDQLEWDWVLDRRDEHVVQQAIRAGCEATCAKQMRQALAEATAARHGARAELLAGRVNIDTVMERGAASRKTFDRRLAQILTPKQRRGSEPDHGPPAGSHGFSALPGILRQDARKRY